ncbi:MAG TPA: MtrB/PioB family decaheme-associated outer membrane protein [Arenimonas sp.]|nr:MtrB/PioB family decaheme-associated outer membrane protein [Arenimonas sp.]
MKPRLPMLLLAVVMPAMGQAQDTACGWVELADVYLDDASSRVGQLAGESRGHRPMLSWVLCRPRNAAVDDGRYWHFTGDRIGSRQRDWRFEGGEYGRWSVFVEQRQLASARVGVRSPFENVGSAHLRLPGDWVAAASTAAMTRLPGSLREAQLGTTRRISRAGLRWQWPGDWQAQWQYREDQRQGLASIAGVVGSTGGNARAILLPMPVDSRSRQFEASVGRAQAALQWQGSVLLSHFDNGIDALRWQNPFAGVAGWHPAAGWPAEPALQPAPDNRYLRIGFALGHLVGEHVRLTADAGFGRATQHQPNLPYSAVPALAATVTQALPRSDLDGRVNSRQLLLRLHSQGSGAWRWRSEYRLDDRDNRSPVDAYVLIPGDAQAQNPAADSSTRRYNIAGDYREQRWKGDLGWRPSRRIDAGLLLEQRRIDRSGSARSDSDERLWRLNLRARLSEPLGLSVRWQESRRRGGSYLGSRPFLDSHAPGYTDTVPGGFENLPDLRQFHLADRDRQQLAVQLHYEARPDLSFSGRIGRTRDDYRASEFGLQHSHLHDWQVEAVYAVSRWSLAAYTGFERARIAQDGRAFQGGANRIPQANDPSRDWRAEHDDRVHTHGLSLRREFAQRGSLSLDYARSQVRGQADVSVGSALTVAPLPATRADLRSLELRGEWALRERVDVHVAWRRERFGAADWASDGVAVNTLANVILLGQESPDYSAEAWMVGVRWGF